MRVAGADDGMLGFMAADVVLSQLVDQATAEGAAIPLALNLPSGRVEGYLTSAEDFSRWAATKLADCSSYTGAVTADNNGYLHLVVSAPDDKQKTRVVRVDMSTVAAWTIGTVD